ncbi:hypothetical protein CO178_00535 [candidate division WWE3 bacterium CG_4_9_14_3_um_filter_34_6]|uniref:Nudix hydrolase domain-containing protein n=1 Tax=candidate division WWE3 bacterium CG_4_9_14_3_um_filter_34_6 TaxID=1975079 RepID=A0A2M7X541_UNCKA|nr:MAG: hypothetical protein CO178_00535 [candidate division WWE3 bacterium CG_4_9_14_3_um_filter_34_6]
MDYKKIVIDENLKLDFSNLKKVIDKDSKFWKRLEAAGASLKGTEDIFSAVFDNGEVREITYQVRRPSTESGGLDLGGYTYLEAYEDPNHKFWEEVELPSPPQLWGIATVIMHNGKILLGKKKPKTIDIAAVFGTKLDNIGGGAVDVEDFEACDTFLEAIKYASLRELGEEAPGAFKPEMLEFKKMVGFFDPTRVKQDALVYWNLLVDPSDIVFPSESEEFETFKFYSRSDIEDEEMLSPHAKYSFDNL